MRSLSPGWAPWRLIKPTGLSSPVRPRRTSVRGRLPVQDLPGRRHTCYPSSAPVGFDDSAASRWSLAAAAAVLAQVNVTSDRTGNGGAGVVGHPHFSTPFQAVAACQKSRSRSVRAGVWESFDPDTTRLTPHRGEHCSEGAFSPSLGKRGVSTLCGP
jgi:hypothetical protein